MTKMIAAALVASTVALAGCSPAQTQRAAVGALVGAGAGATIGAITTGTGVGAATGAGIGAVTGAVIGAATAPAF